MLCVLELSRLSALKRRRAFEVQTELWRKPMKEPELIYFNVSHCEILLAYLEAPADKYIQNHLFLVKQWNQSFVWRSF